MNLRYITRGGYYLPQYQGGNKQWYSFTEKQIEGDLRSIANQLGDLQSPRKFTSGQWFFVDDKQVFFTKEIYVMAFLGAAKSYFVQQVKEFNI